MHHPATDLPGTSLLARLHAVAAGRRPPGRCRAARARRPQRAGARLPRARPAGRGAARGGARAARRRPDPGAARRARALPRRRGLRAAGRRGVRRPAATRRPRLRVTLADRSPRQTNPLLALAAGLLDLAASGSPPPRCSTWPAARRCGCGSGSTTTTSSSCAAGSSAPACAGACRRSTAGPGGSRGWRRAPGAQGLDRLLAGVALDEATGPVGDVLPYDGVASSDTDLAGRLRRAGRPPRRGARAAARAGGRSRCGSRALEEGVATLGEAPVDEAWQRVALRRELDAVRAAAAGSSAALALADVVALLAPRLAGRPTRRASAPAALTVCTLTPMRSVPHRVVCLLGLDDGAFPRGAGVDGDDLLARDPHLGERDPRSEDRQLLLDALVAAEEHLVLTYAGADPRTGAERPPAVPLGELLDALDALATTADGGPARAQVVVHHPLQPFDPRNFTDGALGLPGPLSFDRMALAGARRGRRPAAAGGGVPGRRRCPPTHEPVVELDRLREFWRSPARGLPAPAAAGRRQLAGRGARRRAAAGRLDGLEQWRVADRVLHGPPAGVPAAAVLAAERRPRRAAARSAGRALLSVQTGRRVEALVDAAAPHLAVPARDRRRRRRAARRPACCSGAVGDVHGDVLLRVTALQPQARRPAAGLGHAARRHAPPRPVATGRRSWSAASGRAPAPGAPARSPGAARAGRCWPSLVALRDLGLRPPLPLPVAAAAAFARRAETGGSHRALDRGTWDGGYRWTARTPTPTPLVLGAGCVRPLEVRHRLALPPGRPPTDRLRRPGPPAVGAAAGGRVGERRARGRAVRPRGAAPAAAPSCSRPAPAPARPATIAGLVTRCVAEGAGAPGRAAGGHVRPGGHRRAAHPRARAAAGRRAALATRRPPGGRRPGGRAARDGQRRRRSRSGAGGCSARSRASTRPPSRPPHEFCQRVLRRSARRPTSTRAPCSSRTCATWSPRSSTTSTCAVARPDAGSRLRPRRTALRAGRRRGVRPRGPAAARSAPRPGPARPTCGCASRGRPRARSTCAAGRRGCSASTTCWPACATPCRPGHRPGRLRSGCATASPSCSSTSSRTPTRCSGRCCSRPSTASRTLVVIGDPKQAIYAFRGADVRAYLRRRQRPTTTHDPRHATGAATRRCSTGCRRCCAAPPWATRGSVVRPVRRPGAPRLRSARRRTRRRCGCGCCRATACPYEAGAASAPTSPARRSRPTSPARSRRCWPRASRSPPATDGPAGRSPPATSRCSSAPAGQAALVREALLAAGLPACSPAPPASSPPTPRRDWRCCCEALEQPHRTGRVRRLALTACVGRGATELDAGGDERRRRAGPAGPRLGRRAGRAGRGGAGRDGRAGARPGRPPARGLPDGERRLTDLRHVGEALHAAGAGGLARPGRAAVRGCATGSTTPAATPTQERSRRLDTDAAAVQVLTVHASKGLEFPVVLVPFGWDASGGGPTRATRAGAARGRRPHAASSAARTAPGYGSRPRRRRREDARRGAAAALRRAAPAPSPRLVLWWVPSGAAPPAAPLHRLLLLRRPGRRCPARCRCPATTPRARRGCAALGLAVERGAAVADRRDRVAGAAAPGADRLSAAVLDRRLDPRLAPHLLHRADPRPARTSGRRRLASRTRPRRTTSDAAGAPPAGGGAPAAPTPALRATSPLADGRPARRRRVRHAGARRARARRPVRRRPARALDAAADRGSPAGPTGAEARTRWPTRCCPPCRTPLGPARRRAAAARRAAARPAAVSSPSSCRWRRRRAGPDPRRPRLGDLAGLLQHGTSRRTTRCAATPTLLQDPGAGRAGAARLPRRLARRRRARTVGRYVVVDHKTNRLGPPGRAPHRAGTTGARPSTTACCAPHYPLQALLYTRGAAPLPALAAARLRPRRSTSAACSTCSCAGMCGRRRARRRCRCGPGSRRRPSSSRLSDLLAGR